MQVASVLRVKGSLVATVPDAAVAAVLAVMAEQGVGAVVVVDDRTIHAIMWSATSFVTCTSAEWLVGAVSEIMNTDMINCVPTIRSTTSCRP